MAFASRNEGMRWLILIVSLVFAATVHADELRDFTSTDGQTIRASVVNYNPADGKVVIRREDNRKFIVPFDRFSPEDQAYLSAWREEYDRSFVSLDFMGLKVRSSRVAFVIDQSGSMRGQRWEKLRRNLEVIINDLEMPSDFNIITFNSGATAFRPKALPATDSNKQQAITWLHTQYPDGGTYVGQALKMAMADPQLETIILLTDGYPSDNVGNIFRNVSQQQSQRDRPVSIYTVSYQTDKGVDFLKELAKQHQGQFIRR